MSSESIELDPPQLHPITIYETTTVVVDSDGDDISDTWEYEMTSAGLRCPSLVFMTATSDTDNNGHTDLDEYEADADTFDPNPHNQAYRFWQNTSPHENLQNHQHYSRQSLHCRNDAGNIDEAGNWQGKDTGNGFRAFTDHLSFHSLEQAHPRVHH